MTTAFREHDSFVDRRGDYFHSQAIAALGLLGFAVAWEISWLVNIRSAAPLAGLFLALVALPMAVANLLNGSFYRASSGLQRASHPVNLARLLYKLGGLAGILGCLALAYSIIPEYSKPFYQPVWILYYWCFIPFMLLATVYFLWTDRRMSYPEDAYYHAGLFFTGRWRHLKLSELRLFFLGWLIKGFFLPFMIAGAAERLQVLLHNGVSFSRFYSLYSTSINLLYSVDIAFGAVGYIFTLRALDSQIQSVEGTVLGWLSAIICYAPFSILIWNYVLMYKGRFDWYSWLDRWPVLCITWGFAIVILHVIYVWSTCSFGCRFSNLTNRGIVTTGPYRYVKHPAYLSKNLAWWLMAVPFVAYGTNEETIRACLCLLVTNFIYGVRAWTEERHLRSDQGYKVYCLEVQKHGLAAQIKKLWKRSFNAKYE